MFENKVVKAWQKKYEKLAQEKFELEMKDKKENILNEHMRRLPEIKKQGMGDLHATYIDA